LNLWLGIQLWPLHFIKYSILKSWIIKKNPFSSLKFTWRKIQLISNTEKSVFQTFWLHMIIIVRNKKPEIGYIFYLYSKYVVLMPKPNSMSQMKEDYSKPTHLHKKLILDFCTNFHVGMQDSQRAWPPDQTNKVYSLVLTLNPNLKFKFWTDSKEGGLLLRLHICTKPPFLSWVSGVFLSSPSFLCVCVQTPSLWIDMKEKCIDARLWPKLSFLKLIRLDFYDSSFYCLYA
jgi:hypothetical protein